MHESLAKGSILEIGRPRNLFPLDETASRVTLVAGGIGITPLLAMAHRLHARGTDFQLHVCSRSERYVPFGETLSGFDWAERVTHHLDDVDGSALRAEDLPEWRRGDVLYLCGPTPFMEWVIGLAGKRGWPEGSIHTETFVAPRLDAVDDHGFELVLAKSERTLQVPADRSVLEVLQENELSMAAVCTQGLCGACVVDVVEGEVDHRDVVLGESGRSLGRMTTCVSRAKGNRLVIGL